MTLTDVESADHTFTAFKIREEPIAFEGDLIALSNSCIDVDTAAIQDETTSIETDVNRLSVHDTNGQVFATPDSTGSITTLRRNNNSGGLGDPGSISIGTDNTGASPLTPATPTQSDVGINSSGDASRSPATYATDFTDVSLSAFTAEWDSAATDWDIVSETDAALGGTVLELDAASAGRHALSWDTVGEAADVEVLTLVRVVADTDNFSDWCRSIARGEGGGSGSETGYFDGLNDPNGYSISKYVAGASSGLASTDAVPPVGSWVWTRLRVEADLLKFKYWPRGSAEPDTWALSVTDSDITTAGWAGVGGFPADVQQFDYLAVGVAGASPDTPSTAAGPTRVAYQTSNGAVDT
jgi:hypothetical protein